MTDMNRRTRELIEAIRTAISSTAGDDAFSPEDNVVRAASPHPWPVASSRLPELPESLRALYSACDGLSLPDVHVGYFLHPIARVLSGPARGEPTRIGDSTPIITFGSDGGGGLFALRQSDGAVLYLPVGRITDGCYVKGGAARVVAPSVVGFLERLWADVSAFLSGDAEWRFLV